MAGSTRARRAFASGDPLLHRGISACRPCQILPEAVLVHKVVHHVLAIARLGAKVAVAHKGLRAPRHTDGTRHRSGGTVSGMCVRSMQSARDAAVTPYSRAPLA